MDYNEVALEINLKVAKMLKIILLIFFFLSSYASDNINLQLKWKNSFQFAGFYMAKEKNFYKDLGLDVNIIENSHNISVLKKVLNDKNTYGIMDSALFYWALKGKKTELLMPILDKSPIALIRTNSRVKKLKDIVDKHIATEKNSIKNPSILAMLKSRNIDTDELKTIEYSGEKYKIFKPDNYGFDFYGDILFTSKNEFLKNSKRVKKFMEATKKGWRYAFSHMDETIKVMEKKYNTQHFSYRKLRDEATRLKRYMSINFEFNNAKIKRIDDIYILLNMVSGTRDINDYIYRPFIYLIKKRNRF